MRELVPAPAVVLIVAYTVFPIVAVVTLTLPFTKEAVVAFTAQDEVPYSDPVNDVAVKDPVIAYEPDNWFVCSHLF